MSQRVSQPDNAQIQAAVASAFKEFKHSTMQLDSVLTPDGIRLVSEINALKFFTSSLAKNIERSIVENGMTPAVVRDEILAMLQERAEFLHRVDAIAFGLEALGFDGENLQAGEAEIGFTIPRAMFHNNLEGLTKELGAIRRIISAFAELQGTSETIEVHQISTSDPTFFFGLLPETIKSIGSAVTWAMETLKTLLEIRRLRNDAAKVPKLFTEPELKAAFDDKIELQIKAAVAAEVARLLPEPTVNPRVHEQRTDISLALESILQRVDHGMIVEIRMLPPAQSPSKSGEAAQLAAIYDEITEIRRHLTFGSSADSPILPLEYLGTDETPDASD